MTSKRLKYSELAKALNVNNAVVSMAVKRGYLQADNKKLIDLNLPLNEIWLKKRLAKGDVFDINRIFVKKETPPTPPEEKKERSPKKAKPNCRSKSTIIDDSSSISVDELRKLEIEQKKATLEKTKKQIALDELKIKKQEGLVIPLEAVKSVFSYSIETFVKTFHQEADSLANIFVNILGGEHKHFIELKKELRQKIATIKEESIKNLYAGVDGIVNEFSDKRGRGEKRT